MFFILIPLISLITIYKGNINLPFQYVFGTWILLGFFYAIGFRLHYTYYQNDKNKIIEFDIDSNMIIHQNGYSEKINKSYIEEIINYQSGLNNLTPWNNYEFSVFKLKNGKTFIVTCLLLDIDIIIERFQTPKLIKKSYFIASLNKLQQPTSGHE